MAKKSGTHRETRLEDIVAALLSPGVSFIEHFLGLSDGTRRLFFGTRKPPYRSLTISYAKKLREISNREKRTSNAVDASPDDGGRKS